MKKKKNKFKAIDFFCGAGGMTAGFRKARINVIAGIDIDKECKKTYEKNNKGSSFICTNINLNCIIFISQLIFAISFRFIWNTNQLCLAF